MSVINEALKKTGQSNLSGTKKEVPPVTGGPVLTRVRRSSINWGPVFVVSILVLIVAPILAPIFAPRPGGAQFEETNMKAQFAVEEIPLAAAHAPSLQTFSALPSFLMSGLVYSPEGSYCLINGKVVRVGEVIGGATLIKVTPDEAVLDYQGRKIILPANL